MLVNGSFERSLVEAGGVTQTVLEGVKSIVEVDLDGVSTVTVVPANGELEQGLQGAIAGHQYPFLIA